LTTAGLASGEAGFNGIKICIGQGTAPVSPYSNVSEDGHALVIALDFQKTGIVLHPLAAIADNSPVGYDNTGKSRRLIPVGCDNDVSGRDFTDGDSPESLVMEQRVTKD
jgi:hypothetical protein